MDNFAFIKSNNKSTPSIKKGVEKKYSDLFLKNIYKLKAILRKQYFDKEFPNEDKLANYVFDDEDNINRKKRSISAFKNNPIKQVSLSRNAKIEIDEDINILDKLAMLNMGARYELLNAKQMMVDFELELV